MREVMRTAAERSKIVVMKGSQVAYTETINNIVGFHIAHEAAPILVIQPTIEMAEVWSKDRLAPMLRDCPTLRDRVADPKSRDSGNTIRQKIFPGGRLTIIGANAPSGLAARPIRIVLADEVDRYPVSAGTEGDPLALAAKRQITFWNRFTLVGSTPIVKGASVIEREYLASDQRRYFVPCPHCDHPQTLRWAQVRWNKDAEGGHLPETTLYICEDCGRPWTDAERWAQIGKGGWQAEFPERLVAGFHIPGFLSPWLTLEDIVREFLRAKDDPQLLQVWVNTVLGEPWEEKGETVSTGGFLARREAYASNSLPSGARVLTFGVDVQDNRLELQVMAWGAKEECWAVLYEVFDGDPAQQTLWDELDAVLKERFLTEDERGLMLRAGCIDTGGHHAEMVYRFCKARVGRRVFPTKGASGVRPIWPKRASKARNNNQVHIIGVDTAKDAIYGRLRISKPGPGYIHFPVDDAFDQEYFDQLTAEQVITRYRDGRPYRVWIPKKGQKRNEALDTAVLALAALKSLPVRLDRLAGAAPELDPLDVSNPALLEVSSPPKPLPPAPLPAPYESRSGFLPRSRGFLRRN